MSQGKHGRDRGELEFALNVAAHDGRRACVGRARNVAATAVAAPVRSAVTLPESMMASGVPLAASASTIVPRIVGSPHRRGLSEKLALVFVAK